MQDFNLGDGEKQDNLSGHADCASLKHRLLAQEVWGHIPPTTRPPSQKFSLRLILKSRDLIGVNSLGDFPGGSLYLSNTTWFASDHLNSKSAHIWAYYSSI